MYLARVTPGGAHEKQGTDHPNPARCHKEVVPMGKQSRRPGRRGRVRRHAAEFFDDAVGPVMIGCLGCDWCMVIDPDELELAEMMMRAHVEHLHPECEWF